MRAGAIRGTYVPTRRSASKRTKRGIQTAVTGTVAISTRAATMTERIRPRISVSANPAHDADTTAMGTAMTVTKSEFNNDRPKGTSENASLKDWRLGSSGTISSPRGGASPGSLRGATTNDSIGKMKTNATKMSAAVAQKLPFLRPMNKQFCQFTLSGCKLRPRDTKSHLRFRDQKSVGSDIFSDNTPLKDSLCNSHGPCSRTAS